MKKSFLLLVFCPLLAYAQQDTIALKSVDISDYFLNANQHQQVIELSDSTQKQHEALLSDIIQFRTPIYLKQNGAAMVSSPSFRGTTASQTAVLWNGINVNAATNGQADFNQFFNNASQRIDVKLGGGSIAHGTGAIGGSVHLQNHFDFGQGWQNELSLQVGSFETYHAHYFTQYSNDRLAAQLGYNRFQTKNNYRTPNEAGRNLNGEYLLNQFNLGVAYKLNAHNQLKLISETNFGDRHFSLVSPNETPTKYETWNHRFLTEWSFAQRRFESNLRLAYLNETSDYFTRLTSQNPSSLNVETLLAKYWAAYRITPNMKLHFLTDFSHNRGNGDKIDDKKRDIWSVGLMMQHQLSPTFRYEIGARKEETSAFESPILYSIGLVNEWTTWWKMRLHHSKNYRIPTYNDLYWEASGNPNLKAENAYQFEMGNEWKFKQLELKWNLYYNTILDLIQWVPSGSSSLWVPINQAKVKTYGSELMLLARYNKLSFDALYAYTQTHNEKTDKALIYTPEHQVKASLQFHQKWWNVFAQLLYTGKVYTLTDESEQLNDNTVVNLGGSVELFKAFDLQVKINNIFDHYYQSLLNRWMPGINYQITILYKF
ncbi:TonB-dependent receptor plug domain-containing protein [Vaginella massiliensis]|uniref:TonB-dependent receptor plug domain-containing protein n=1 Tax=Vaginella massiliensis TaxID=1816680 RepID=UPI0008389D62|nr:TonB-dependent receptor [Vaginella massiliensis]